MSRMLSCHRLTLYIIAGPNGVGKTTFAREFPPHYVECLVFVCRGRGLLNKFQIGGAT